MKNILFILLLTSIFGYGQDIVVDDVEFRGSIKSILVVDSCRGKHVKYSFDGRKRVIEIVYDGYWDSREVITYKGKKLIKEQQYINGFPKFQLYYKYKRGKLLNVREFSGDTLKLCERYIYNGNDELIEKQQIIKDTIAHIEKYKYDKKLGLRETTSIVVGDVFQTIREYKTPKTEIYEIYGSSDSIPYYKTVLLYDDDENTIEERKWINGYEHPYVINEYNKNTIRKSIKYEAYDNKILDETFYNDKGKKLKEIHYKFEEKDNNNSILKEIFYDGQGNPVKEINNDSGITYSAINRYDKTNNLVEVKVYENGKYICTTKYNITYR